MVNDERLVFLVEQLKTNEHTYFNEFYELTKKMCFYMCYSIVKNHADAEDAMQNAYINFLNNIKKVDTSKTILGYLIKIAKNCSLNYIKKRKIQEIELEETYQNSSNSLEYEEVMDKMKELLKPIEFQVVFLHIINEMKHVEIAKVLKKPLGTITYTYKCAIDKLRRDLK